MKRTNQPTTNGQAKNGVKTSDVVKLQNMSALVSRLALAGNLGLSFGGTRDVYAALGYPLEIKADDFREQWQRQPLARAIVDRPVKKTWQGDLAISEPTEEDETELEKTFKRLDEKLGLKKKLMRVDRLAQLGEFSVLLLGFDDSSRNTWPQPVEEGERDLKYVRPISKENVDVHKYETDPSNPRFGKPRIYKIDLDLPEGTTQNTETNVSLEVHYTRVIHVAFDLLENEIEGNPVMKTAYNRLKDLEKLVGGSAEMFWRGARPGYQAKAQKDYSVDDKTEEALRDQIDEYENNLRRILTTEGIDMENLEQQVSDPGNHFKMQVQCLSAVTGIPLRILIGSERGELASSQDQQNFEKFIQTRRTEEAEPNILRPFVDRLIEYGVLPEPKEKEEGYSIIWAELSTLGEKEKAEVGKGNAEALGKYAANPAAESIVPLEAFLKYFLKFDEDTVKQIIEFRDAEMEEAMAEEEDMEELEQEMERIESEEQES